MKLLFIQLAFVAVGLCAPLPLVGYGEYVRSTILPELKVNVQGAANVKRTEDGVVAKAVLKTVASGKLASASDDGRNFGSKFISAFKGLSGASSDGLSQVAKASSKDLKVVTNNPAVLGSGDSLKQAAKIASTPGFVGGKSEAEITNALASAKAPAGDTTIAQNVKAQNGRLGGVLGDDGSVISGPDESGVNAMMSDLNSQAKQAAKQAPPTIGSNRGGNASS